MDASKTFFIASTELGYSRGARRSKRGIEFAARGWNHAKGVYIINSVGIVYHQRLAVVYHQGVSLVYHQAAGKCTLMRDEIQPQKG